jgi:hypothetical protein
LPKKFLKKRYFDFSFFPKMLDRRPKCPQPDPVCPGHPLLMMLYTPLIQSVSDVWRQHKELHEKVDWEKIFRALRDWGYTMGKMRIELMIDSTLIEKKNCKFGKIAVRKMAFLRSAIERLEVVGFCDDFILSSSQSKY